MAAERSPGRYLPTRNGSLWIQLFGETASHLPPVLLIHGSTIDGSTDWAHVVPRLATTRQVIVPDCRGHGRSPNPECTYSFAEMADDMAAIIEALGVSDAHVVGHSNGGNVALVMVISSPRLVRSAVLQAANAQVTDHLSQREPDKFDPDRVARDSPEWRDEMIAIHGATHGEEYWRKLLELTVAETLSEPHYTPDDLALVRTPVLVVEGQADEVNAPAGHGAFLADSIPRAESWFPESVGHNVHHEVADAWVNRVERFMDRHDGTAPATR